MLSNSIYKISQLINPIVAGAAQKNSIQFLRKILLNTMFENITYVSGGYVRDYVKNIQSNDLDLVVQMQNGSKQLSDFILLLFDGYITYQKLNPFYPTYKLFFKDNIVYGNTKYLLKGADIDISDTAKARYSQDSGKEKDQLFIYGNLTQDAYQRDFTMNALYQNIFNLQIIDPTGLGIRDIKNNLLRLIPNEKQSQKLYNNPKLLLRYCRFYAKYKMNVLSDDIVKLKKYAYRITSLYQDQIMKQLKKINASDFKNAVSMMQQIGIYEFIQQFI